MEQLGYLPVIQDDGGIKVFVVVHDPLRGARLHEATDIPDPVRATLVMMFPDFEFRLNA